LRYARQLVEMLPARGPPSVAEMPVNNKQRPKAFVRFSKPSSSTSRIERNEAKQPAEL